MIYTLAKNPPAFRECARCIMNNHVTSEISFDENGVCSYCETFDRIKSRTFGRPPEVRKQELEDTLKKIKEQGKGRKYDCVIGLSGGVDSTYLAYLAKQWGLRALAVHFDNGWNSELSVKNIENIIRHTGFDLYTHVINWEDFKAMQIAYLKASVVDIEVLTDQMIFACLFDITKKHDISYLLSGTNYSTELVLAPDWVFAKYDLNNIKNIYKRFGTRKIKNFPKLGYFELIKYRKRHKIEFVEVLNLIDYRKNDVMSVIEKEFEWKYYGGKHYESVWTKFYQGYILPVKFGFDKRYGHLSNLIMNGEITKAQAKSEIKHSPIEESETEELLNFVLKKFDLGRAEWDKIMANEPVKHEMYGTENDDIRIRLHKSLFALFSKMYLQFRIRVGSPVKKALLGK